MTVKQKSRMESLGKSLFQDTNTKNFDLIIDDTISRKLIHVHKLVLQNSSPFFLEKLGGIYFFFFIFQVPPGYIEAATQVINYMYTRDLNDLDFNTYSHEIQKLCLILEMPQLHYLSRLREVIPKPEYCVDTIHISNTHNLTVKSKHSNIYCTRSKKQMILRNRH